jgi:UDP-2,4-diacetamido-2,4,6-trideoxy-beta-L-altropyranose hydrolase
LTQNTICALLKASYRKGNVDVNCVIRVDSAVWMGIGHVSRCLTLAEELRRNGVEVLFVCREHTGAALGWIESFDFPLRRLPVSGQRSVPASYADWLGEDWRLDSGRTEEIIRQYSASVDWLIVDHYGIDQKWEEAMRNVARRIFVIDDLADRRHDCDLLLDHNIHDGEPYRDLVPQSAKVLSGPEYALLREEFREARAHVEVRSGLVRRIVLFFGGSDPTGETVKALFALQQLDIADIEVDVIVGEGNPRKDEVAQICSSLDHVQFHCQVPGMARFLAHADLALGAAGVSSWERLALGVPTLVVAVADNQVENMQHLDRLGVAIGMGASSEVSAASMVRAITAVLAAPERLHIMSKKALELVDGKGVLRVTERLKEEM